MIQTYQGFGTIVMNRVLVTRSSVTMINVQLNGFTLIAYELGAHQRASGTVLRVGNCQSFVEKERNDYSWGTTDGQRFTHAQHTLTILSMVDILLSLLSVISEMGRIFWSIVYFCFNTPMMRST